MTGNEDWNELLRALNGFIKVEILHNLAMFNCKEIN